MTTYDDLLDPRPAVDRDHLQRLVDGWRGKQRLRNIPISACIAYGECADALAAVLENRPGCPVMGTVENITDESYPVQGRYLGMRAEVVFHYDTHYRTRGTVIRDDTAAPGLLIIQLDDGRVVLSTECQWRPFLDGAR